MAQERNRDDVRQTADLSTILPEEDTGPDGAKHLMLTAIELARATQRWKPVWKSFVGIKRCQALIFIFDSLPQSCLLSLERTAGGFGFELTLKGKSKVVLGKSQSRHFYSESAFSHFQFLFEGAREIEVETFGT